VSVKPCLTCGALTRHGSRCPEHQRAYEREKSRRRGGAQKLGYTRQWQQAAHAAIDAQPWCSTCGATTDLTGDHIVARAHGGPGVSENVTVLCRSCNAKKGMR
jgi:5-methylcytosine-specific restriction endonuclease McrA